MATLFRFVEAVRLRVKHGEPLAGEAGGFLRVLRTLRLLQTYQLLARLRADSAWFRRNEELALSVVHLVVFLFVVTGIVYETQYWANPDIRNYVDALYSR
jgi:voltage-gated potassium channel